MKPVVVALIPARGSSKGVPRKNIKLLAGKPLIAYTIECAKKSKYLDKIFVSTEDAEIVAISKKYGAEIIKRPKELAEDTVKTQEVVKHAFESLDKKPDFIVLLQPTSPFRTLTTIDSAIKKFIENKDYDSLMPLKKLQVKKGVIVNNLYIPKCKGEKRRQELSCLYYECGTIFIYKKENIIKENIYGTKIMPFVIESEIEAVDIETPEDFEIAEAIMAYKNEKTD